MASFDSVIGPLLKAEGLYTVDTGGRTMRGITEARWNEYKKKTGLFPGMDVSQITEAIARKFYRDEEWARIKGDQISSQSVANVLMDWTVNAGNVAIKAAQKLLGIDADGVLGSQTLAAINRAGSSLANKLTNARIAFYQALAAKNPAKYGAYLKGWLTRARKFLVDEPVGSMAGIASLVVIGGAAAYAWHQYRKAA